MNGLWEQENHLTLVPGYTGNIAKVIYICNLKARHESNSNMYWYANLLQEKDALLVCILVLKLLEDIDSIIAERISGKKIFPPTAGHLLLWVGIYQEIRALYELRKSLYHWLMKHSLDIYIKRNKWHQALNVSLYVIILSRFPPNPSPSLPHLSVFFSGYCVWLWSPGWPETM